MSPFAKAECSLWPAALAPPRNARRACELARRSTQKTSFEELPPSPRTLRLRFGTSQTCAAASRREQSIMHGCSSCGRTAQNSRHTCSTRSSITPAAVVLKCSLSCGCDHWNHRAAPCAQSRHRRQALVRECASSRWLELLWALPMYHGLSTISRRRLAESWGGRSIFGPENRGHPRIRTLYNTAVYTPGKSGFTLHQPNRTSSP